MVAVRVRQRPLREVCFEIIDDTVTLEQRNASVSIDEIWSLVFAARCEFVVGYFVRHVATFVTGRSRVMDDVGDAQFGKRFSNLLTVRASFGLVEFQHGHYIVKCEYTNVLMIGARCPRLDRNR